MSAEYVIPIAGESFTPTPKLRWNMDTGKLEQMWQGSQGTQSWEEVPNYQPPKSNTVPSDTSK